MTRGGAEARYLAFRSEWNAVKSRSAYDRLGHAGMRRERMLCRGVRLDGPRQAELDAEFGGTARVRQYMQIVGSSYCRMTGRRWFDAGYGAWDEGKAERYVEWLTSAGASGRWTVCGRRERTGRTGKGYMKHINTKKK